MDIRQEVSRPPCKDSMSMLEIKHLRKSFGSLVAVDDVSFALDRGHLVGLLGPNGAGKTTTVSMIAGFVTPEQGEVGTLTHSPAWRFSFCCSRWQTWASRCCSSASADSGSVCAAPRSRN